MDDAHESAAFCPYYHHAVELIGRRWTGAIVRALLTGIQHFNDVAAAIPGLSDRMLSERLKELETEGIVQRLVWPEKPVRIEYVLTEKGRALGSVVEAVSGWAEAWAVDSAILRVTQSSHIVMSAVAPPKSAVVSVHGDHSEA